MKHKSFIEEALHAVITGSSNCHTDIIARYFSPDYSQTVDGNVLSYDEFVQHIKLLHQVLKSATIKIIAMAEHQDTIFTHHHVYAIKYDGSQIHTQVMAQFTVQAGKIIACNELTRLIGGDKTDHNLGSRLD